MLCSSSQQSRGHRSPATPDPVLPKPSSKLDVGESGEAALMSELKTFDLNRPVRNTSHGEHYNTTAGNTNPALPAGAGFFACASRAILRRSSPATNAASSSNRKLMSELIRWEIKFRQQLIRHEQEELVRIVWSVEKKLAPVMVALREVNTLDVVQKEVVRRWCIQNDYLRFLLDVAQLQEVLHRRSLSFVEEPQGRKRIENAEATDWIETRKVEMMREAKEYAAEKREDRERRLAYANFIQQQQYQIFLLELSEQDGRMEVERMQRLYAGCLLEERAKEYRNARLSQLKFEAMRFELQPEAARNLTADEAQHRTFLYHEQAAFFKKMQADEIRNYLASSRQELLNRRVEES